MQERHIDRNLYFNEQKDSTEKYVLPYIQKHFAIKAGMRVLEVGCGEGGNLFPFLEIGCECYGVELSKNSFENAVIFYANNQLNSHLHLLNRNIYDTTVEEFGGKFDVIFLRDVIEHIPQQEIFMYKIKDFLKQDGVIFFAFPPFRMPFGGHQQICKSNILSKLPYFHLLPKKNYKNILRKFGENPSGLMEIYETGISINRFEKIIQNEDYQIVAKTHWLVNPNYQIKFGLKPRKVYRFFQIPHLQDFYTTAIYCLLKKND